MPHALDGSPKKAAAYYTLPQVLAVTAPLRDALQVSEGWVRRHIPGRRKLPGKKTVRFRRAAVDRWVTELLTEDTP